MQHTHAIRDGLSRSNLNVPPPATAFARNNSLPLPPFALKTLAPVFERLHAVRASGLYRDYVECGRLAAFPGRAISRNSEIDVWCGNDYLGLSFHPQIINALAVSAREHGVGTGGSRNISGTSPAHVTLEKELAHWHGKAGALVFNSGYGANYESISTLVETIPGLAIFSDRLNHRSLIEGMRSRKNQTHRHVFEHNDISSLRGALATYPKSHPKLIVFESVYSMDGDFAPIAAICDLAEEYNALTYVDETHAIGVLGATGAGLAEHLSETRPTFIQGVFGKAIGVTGGYVAGPAEILDYIRSVAPGFIFTTSLPHATLDAVIASLKLIQSGNALREKLFDNVSYTKEALARNEIPYLEGESQLVLIPLPGADRIKAISRALLETHDIYVQPINYPSVRKGGERFRISVLPSRTRAEIDHFVSALKSTLTAHG